MIFFLSWPNAGRLFIGACEVDNDILMFNAHVSRASCGERERHESFIVDLSTELSLLNCHSSSTAQHVPLALPALVTAAAVTAVASVASVAATVAAVASTSCVAPFAVT